MIKRIRKFLCFFHIHFWKTAWTFPHAAECWQGQRHCEGCGRTEEKLDFFGSWREANH